MGFAGCDSDRADLDLPLGSSGPEEGAGTDERPEEVQAERGVPGVPLTTRIALLLSCNCLSECYADTHTHCGLKSPKVTCSTSICDLLTFVLCLWLASGGDDLPGTDSDGVLPQFAFREEGPGGTDEHPELADKGELPQRGLGAG